MNSILRLPALVAALCMFGTSCTTHAEELPNAPAIMVGEAAQAIPKRVLFVGNSYLYYNDSLHNHVQRMAVAAGLVEESELSYKSATIGGAALRDHAIDHLLDPANLRVDGPFEIVVLQGASSAALSANGRRRFAEAAEAAVAKVRASGGEPVLYMTHAYVSPHARARPEMTGEVAALYAETGKRLGVRVIPVGLAFAEAYRRRPDIVLHKSFDGTHPDMLGTYLAACTVFAVLYDTSPVGNSYSYFGEVSPEDALFLQQVAADVVGTFNVSEGTR